MIGEVLTLLGAFAGATSVAEIAGAANLGTAATFGQLTFAAVLVGLLTRR